MELVDGHLIVMYGNNSSAMVPNLYAFSIVAGGWTQLVSMGDTVSPRSGHTVTVIKNKLYLIGGKQIFPNMRTYNDVMVGSFDADNASITWKQLQPVGQEVDKRAYHTSVVYRDVIYSFGGIVNNVYCRDLCSFNPATLTWHTYAQGVPPTYQPTTARSGHIALVNGSDMYVFGSYSEDTSDMSLYALCLETFVWRTVQTKGIAPPRRAAPSGVLLPADPLRSKLPRLLVFGGFDISARKCFNELFCITL